MRTLLTIRKAIMGEQHDGAPPDMRDSGAPLMGEATQGLSSGSGVGVPRILLLDTQIRSFGMGIVRLEYKGVSAW